MKTKILLILVMLFFSFSAFAGSPYYVDRNTQGKPYRWKNNRVNIYLDNGKLVKSGNTIKSFEDGKTLIDDVKTIWEKVSLPKTSELDSNVEIPVITINTDHVLNVDITKDNYEDYFFSSDPNIPSVIIFDEDGAIFDDLADEGVIPDGSQDSIFGLTAVYFDEDNLDNIYFTRGSMIINGKKMASGNGWKLRKVTIAHELGHFIGLDHSSVNADFVDSRECGDFCEYIPTMYYTFVTTHQSILHYDDKVWAAYIYNYDKLNSPLKTDFCMIKGEIFDVKGRGLQGAQLTMNETSNDNDNTIAVTSISGGFYPECTVDDEDKEIKSGQYIIPGVRVGQDYRILAGSIPNWCSGRECSLSSGVNPYAPPREVETSEISNSVGDLVFTCDEGGKILEARPVQVENDLDDEEYKDYEYLGYVCAPGVGREIAEPEPEPIVTPSGLSIKKGWCSLIGTDTTSYSFIFFFIPAVFFITRRVRIADSG